MKSIEPTNLRQELRRSPHHRFKPGIDCAIFTRGFSGGGELLGFKDFGRESGLGLLTLCTSQLTACSDNAMEDNLLRSPPSTFQVIFFFSSLYLIGIGSAGYKTCLPAFGADQFDKLNSNESKSNSSFFNWWMFGQSVGSYTSHLILNYIQDNLGWGLASGISSILMVIALLVIMSGIKSYRYTLKKDADKVQGSRKAGTSSSITKVEDVKAVLRLVLVWIICLMYTVVQAQVHTFFIKQGSTMDRSIGPDFHIPSASTQILFSTSIMLFSASYDRIFVPVTQTGNSNGIATLERIGVDIFISTITMVVAGIVEDRRLRIAQEFGLIDDPKATVPMVVWWLIPQYVLPGLALVFTAVGLQKIFYDQVPNGIRSVGLSLYSTMFGLGDFLSVFLISGIQKVTSAGGQHGWIATNINQAHLDYFYWFLAGLSVIQLVAFLCFSKSYVYKQGAPINHQ
ncbi:hypothetical protein C5167_011999 [Papaver somniferum]|uniref:Major facilitator superfamily (MFS) profile domain-containing protein n=1 Tax=Papaver somniferum TaxID=3469 RepID=A0A4Y7IW81_PAPSO|nr:hypothetical protein C5167_011999 [Papaver somniferum]